MTTTEDNKMATGLLPHKIRPVLVRIAPHRLWACGEGFISDQVTSGPEVSLFQTIRNFSAIGTVFTLDPEKNVIHIDMPDGGRMAMSLPRPDRFQASQGFRSLRSRDITGSEDNRKSVV